MAATLKTYIVVSPFSVVVEDGGKTTSYAPGDRFQEFDNNVSVQRLLAAGSIVESSGVPQTGTTVVVPGPQGPTGPTGPPGSAAESLALTLIAGNTTGATDIVIVTGQQVQGGRANFGGASAATVDGDLAAGDGVREMVYIPASNALRFTGGDASIEMPGGSDNLRFSALGSGPIRLNEIGHVVPTGALSGFSLVRCLNTVSALSVDGINLAIGGTLDGLDLPASNLATTLIGAAGTLTTFQARRGLMGSSGTTTIQLEINGSPIAGSTLTWDETVDPSNARKTVSINQAVAVGDRISLRVTSVGPDAEDIFAEVH